MFHLTLSRDIKNIFEGFCILKKEETVDCRFSYPSDYQFQQFYDLIFPCDCLKEKSEEYCIVVSNHINDRSFILCKYVYEYQSYLCIHSHNPLYEIFSKLLFNLSHSDFMPDKYTAIELYLESIISFETETRITLPACSANDNVPQHILRSSLQYPYIYDKYIQEYLTAINSGSSYNKQLWLEVFCSMLLERPIIFMSKRYQKLTSSMLAATFFIHPLSWSHKFISIVPQKTPQFLGTNCCLLGIHRCMEPILDKVEFWNEALLVDLDSGDSKMVGPSDDQKETKCRFMVPKSIKKFFVKHIELVDASLSSNTVHKIKDLISNTPWNINIEEIMYNDYKKGFHIYPLLFRTIMSILIGNYRQFIYFNNHRYDFEKNKFIQCDPKLSGFLYNFVQSQCFDSFIEEKLKCFESGQEMSDRFDRERLELNFKTKNSNNKIKELISFRKNSFSGSNIKVNAKVERIEKISTMPNPKKEKKIREKHSLTIFHVKSQSLSSSLASIGNNVNQSLDHLSDNISNNSESLNDPVHRDRTEKGLILARYRPSHLSTISSHTITDSDDLLMTSAVDISIRICSKLSDCIFTKSENVLLQEKPPRPLYKTGDDVRALQYSVTNEGNGDILIEPQITSDQCCASSRVQLSEQCLTTKQTHNCQKMRDPGSLV